MIEKVSVIGAGAWGTTIANLLARKGVPVSLWVHSPQNEALLTNRRSAYLPGISLSESIHPTTSIETALQYANHWIFAVPSRHLPVLMSGIQPYTSPKIHLLSLVKGMILLDEPMWLSDFFGKTLPVVPGDHFSILSGPNFALEIAQNLIAATVIASTTENEAVQWQNLLITPNFRVYTNTDLIGVQLGGVMKNIIALAAGILDGRNLGFNSKSALIVRGIHEMKRMALLVGANPETLTGLSGLGDLIGTCTSPLSRNLWAGKLLGQGITVDDIRRTNRTVESIDALPAVLALVKGKVEMPICEALYAILFENKPVMDALRDLMGRSSKPE